MNPVRSFGPAVLLAATPNEYQPDLDLEENIFRGHWVYWIGPILGAAIASVTHRILGMNCFAVKISRVFHSIKGII